MTAEELIVEIYRQRSELAGRGDIPGRAIMSAEHYRLIQDYRSRLGDVPAAGTDYLDAHRLFDLDICIDQTEMPRVEPLESGGIPAE